MLRILLGLFVSVAGVVCYSDDSVPVPPDAATENSSQSELDVEKFLIEEFGLTLKDNPLSIMKISDARNNPPEPLPESHRIYEVSSRTWSPKTNRYIFGKKHRVGSMAKLASLMKSRQFQECSIIDFKTKDSRNDIAICCIMRLSELDKERKSGLQTDVPFGVAPSIRAN